MIELEVIFLSLFSHGRHRLGLGSPNGIHFTTAYSLQGWIFYCCKGTPFKVCPLFPVLLQTTEESTREDTVLTMHDCNPEVGFLGVTVTQGDRAPTSLVCEEKLHLSATVVKEV